MYVCMYVMFSCDIEFKFILPNIQIWYWYIQKLVWISGSTYRKGEIFNANVTCQPLAYAGFYKGEGFRQSPESKVAQVPNKLMSGGGGGGGGGGTPVDMGHTSSKQAQAAVAPCNLYALNLWEFSSTHNQTCSDSEYTFVSNSILI